MRPYSSDDADAFFGRDTEIAEICGRLRRGERELFVIGPSGSGKSSLVVAGVLERLKKSVASGEELRIICIRPGERPASRLSEALQLGEAAGAVDPKPLGLQSPSAQRRLLFVDQLEELFAFAEENERNNFLSAVEELRNDTHTTVLYALRADFYGELMNSALWADGQLSRIDVAPLRGRALLRAIQAPAAAVGVYIEPRLCERLIGDVANEPGTLPLLQETLVMLWETRTVSLLRSVEYEALGDGERSGLAVALSQHADGVLRKMTTAEQGLARSILLKLVNFGEGRADTRRQQSRNDLRISAADKRSFDDVLSHLVFGRLLTASHAGENAQIDLAHEALLGSWPILKEWIKSRRSDEQRRRGLEDRARDWTTRGRAQGGLLDELQLREARDWLAGDTATELGASADLISLVDASASAINAAKSRTLLLRGAAIALAGVLTILGLVTLAAGRQASASARLAQHRADMVRAESIVAIARTQSGSTAALLILQLKNSGLPAASALAYDTLRKPIEVVSVRHFGHKNVVGKQLRVAVSPDASYFVTTESNDILGADPAQAVVWSRKGAMLASLEHEGKRGIPCAAISPDGNTILTASIDKTARLWSRDGSLRQTLPLEAPATCAAFSRNGSHFVVWGGAAASIWTAGGAKVRTVRHETGGVLSAELRFDGSQLLTTGNDGTARLWDIATGRDTRMAIERRPPSPLSKTGINDGHEIELLARSLLSQPGIVSNGHISPDGALVAASVNGSLQVWDNTGKPKWRVNQSAELTDTNCVSFTPDSQLVLFGTKRGVAAISRNGEVVATMVQPRGVNSMDINGDGSLVTTSSLDGITRVWSLRSGALTTATPAPGDAGADAKFMPDSSGFVSTSWSGTTTFWSYDKKTIVLGYAQPVVGAVISSDSDKILTSTHEGVCLWLTNGTKQHCFDENEYSRALAFNREGSLFLAATGNHVKIWSTRGTLQAQLTHERSKAATFVDDHIEDAAFSPDGKKILTGAADGTAQLWSVSGSELVSFLHGDHIKSVAFSPDGRSVLTTSTDQTARLWTLEGQEIVTLKHDNIVWRGRFSPDGSRIVTVSRDGTARLWSSQGVLIVVLHHDGTVDDAEFSPDGQTVVTASGDHTSRIWDLAGREIAILQHEQAVFHVAFDRTGGRIVTASADGTARIWSAVGQPLGSLKYEGSVSSATFSANGQLLLTSSLDGSVRLSPVPEASNELFFQLGRRTQMCLLPTQRRAWLSENAEEASNEYERCERGYGRRPE